MDCSAIARELGVKRATAERVMRGCDTKIVLGRRTYVYRDEVFAAIRAHEVREAA